MHWRIVERGMEFGWLFIAISAVLVVLGIAHLIKLMTSGKRIFEESPLRILKRRYARGEITREEFEKIKDDLKKGIC